MNVIQFARAMRRRGWRYTRLERGKIAFGVRMGALGCTRVFTTEALAACRIIPMEMAEFVTRDAAISLGHDLRRHQG